jgi:monoamine oxidase
MYSRRKIIQWIAASGLATSSPLASRLARAQPRSVIVIGAGAAGLAAADFLRNQRQNVTVLEARNRIGGRVHTDYDLAPFPVELGAEFIHGEHVSTFDLARRQGLDLLPAFEDERNYYAYLDDALIAPPEWFLIPRINLIDDGFYTLAEVHENSSKSDINLAELLESRGIVLDEGLYRLIDNAIQAEYAATLVEQGAYGLLELEDDPGGDRRIAEGYTRLFEAFARGLDIRLSTVVESIAWSSSGVRITTRDGQRLDADQCIITVPLKILQDQSIRFEPALPEQKRAAINGLGSGAMGKVILRFDEPFWDERIELLYTDLPMQLGWRPGFGRDETPVFTAYFGAASADMLAQMGEDGAITSVLEDLQQVFRIGNLGARVVDSRVAHWVNDPFSKMGYSYTPVGSAGLRAVLAAPTDGVLFWAGEATNVGRPALVHGAFDSGVRAAREVLGLQR